MPSTADADVITADLDARLRVIAERLPSGSIGVGGHDYLSGRSWSFNGDRSFHAASIIKLVVLAALFDAVREGDFTLDCRLHVRNRFLSVVEGAPFRVDQGRDADAKVYAALGRTMRVRELARHMIVTSSNLATNLLFDLVGVDRMRDMLQRLGVEGVDVCRGVEDDRAFEQGISNRMTPNGAVQLLRAINEAPMFAGDHATEMLDLLQDQQFTGTIAPGLPESIRAAARVAHKTGDISTVSHDAGFVYLPGRPPYVVAIFVESSGESRERVEIGTAASTAVYECVAAAGERPVR
jgi:beta-lactamase class A